MSYPLSNEILEIITLANKTEKHYAIRKTAIFNEGWLLNLFLHFYIDGKQIIPFSNATSIQHDTIWFSEGKLPTPFLRGKLKGDYSDLDGIVGEVKIGVKSENGNQTKSRIGLKDNIKNLIVFEAKMNSDLSPGISNDEKMDKNTRLDQLARICLDTAWTILSSGIEFESMDNVVVAVIYREECVKEILRQYLAAESVKDLILDKIKTRFLRYEQANKGSADLLITDQTKFDIAKIVQNDKFRIMITTWEEQRKKLPDAYSDFYELCKNANDKEK